MAANANSSLLADNRRTSISSQRSGRRYHRSDSTSKLSGGSTASTTPAVSSTASSKDSATSLSASAAAAAPASSSGGSKGNSAAAQAVSLPPGKVPSTSVSSRGGHRKSNGDVSEEVHDNVKIILIGDSAVGKTCLMVRFNEDAFVSGNFISTVGIDFRTKVVVLDKKRVHLQIWDTAGQERFRSITGSYYRDADAILLVYDVSNPTTFEHLSGWLATVKELAPEDVSLLLVANKSDVGSAGRRVSEQSGHDLAQAHHIPLIEVSAKTGENASLAFEAVARSALANRAKKPAVKGKESSDKFDLEQFVAENRKKSACSC